VRGHEGVRGDLLAGLRRLLRLQRHGTGEQFMHQGINVMINKNIFAKKEHK
jgi:hypothetical protein